MTMLCEGVKTSEMHTVSTKSVSAPLPNVANNSFREVQQNMLIARVCLNPKTVTQCIAQYIYYNNYNNIRGRVLQVCRKYCCGSLS